MAIELPKNNAASNRVGNTSSPLTSARTAQASAAQTAQPQAPQKADSVMITSQAQQLQSVQSKLSSLPEVDQKKVAEIKQAIAEGRYKIDPEKLAANIASFEAELQELGRDA
ncbi:flagellar biosynthesis anti-sigma factor FlgM [Shewanella litorisediminis]|uniref:Negative regulator of flagellin synthesis n=1 Tax=Shewanella litorisediminis TaxID=1173586 RepID=A0ABX7FZY1_9GAMM|nr:flagellar biosynthesis anti-sigma factor FlgM [Shewanella litorisediminis]MCL2919705.1 flagellar biosynthesis anti-sigma factor FlgM [Shewanella litorisediminis]QRH00589.1 flagellar biosynthesis anti-sigma factor FlgM [Shewanella litorisediminis]